MNSHLSCFLVLAAAGLVQAAFAIPIKLFRGWRWEHMWAAQALTSNLFFPFLWGCVLPARFWDLAQQLPTRHWVVCYGLGLLWGMGGAAYGFTLTRLGLCFAYSFVFGATTLTGALLPLLFNIVELPVRPALFILGLAICLAAIVAVGFLRRGTPPATSMAIPISCPSYGWALLLALLAGVFSASYGVAFSIGFPVVSALIRNGVPEISAPLVVALPVYLGSASVAIPLALICAFRSGTLNSFYTSAKRNWLLALLMGACGTGGVILYGWGSSARGHAAPNVSFGIFMTLFVVAGNAMGWLTGELRGRSMPATSGLLISIAALICAAWLLNLR